MDIKAGTIADFSNSMAEAMETALKAEYLAVKGEPLPDQGVEDRRMLLVAVAQGVARYLKDNTDAWQISVETTLDNATEASGSGTVDGLSTTGTLYS
ncbi:hypothetical protein SAMN05421688_0863 [Poseidonocella pacifica]|uniref:Uncharacterized protein n=1 Tax=Poseidonocella pacifica TaxID=871651 RepID=A0A1I0VPW4_9RHOB|nr:hypothetical protein [Poseidonocella pacifica]SFA78469.1 hypothetical protein SAMN05421688_0863 [Poseidonocella pacifica]